MPDSFEYEISAVGLLSEEILQKQWDLCHILQHSIQRNNLGFGSDFDAYVQGSYGYPARFWDRMSSTLLQPLGKPMIFSKGTAEQIPRLSAETLDQDLFCHPYWQNLAFFTDTFRCIGRNDGMFSEITSQTPPIEYANRFAFDHVVCK